MTSFLARIGSLESRLASQTLWSSGKRKRTDWVCAECKARRALRQRRAYADGSLKITPENYLFPSRGVEEEDPEEIKPTRSASWGKGTFQWKSFALGSVEHGPDPGEVLAARDEPVLSDDQRQNTLWEEFEQADEEVGERVADSTFTDAVNTPLEASADPSLLEVDYTSILPQALAKNEPDMVARCLYAAERKNDIDFIRSIPRTTFSECIRILQPSNFIAPLASAHLEMSDVVARQLGFSSIHQVAWQHLQVLKDILAIRHSAGIRVGLTEYKLLLRSARDLGNRAVANYIWNLMLSEGVTPDTACYNSMMSANVWNGTLHGHSRHKIRVIRFFQLARQTQRLGVAFANYRVGKGGLKEQVMRVFSDMLKHGAIADEESFCIVIVAAAREGDLATIKSVLRKVWDIDVDALVSGKDDTTITPKAIDHGSPLRPTSRLLFSIAHAFGANNDVPTALRLVDFVARRYEINIGIEVWEQLFEWTFVLAKLRTGIKARTDDSRTGQLPLQSVLSLWETMTGPPYFIKPTIGMYNHLIKNLQHRNHTPMMYLKMCEGKELYHNSVRCARRAFRRLQNAVDSEVQNTNTSPETLRREWEYLDLVRKRNLFWCKRWLRLLLSTLRSYNRIDEDNSWALREIPRILWEWRHFTPTVVIYDTVGGVVELRTRTEGDIEEQRKLREDHHMQQANALAKVPLFVSEQWVKPKHWSRIPVHGEIPP